MINRISSPKAICALHRSYLRQHYTLHICNNERDSCIHLTTGYAHQRHFECRVLSPLLLWVLVRTRDGVGNEQYRFLPETRHRCGRDQALQRQHDRHGQRVTSRTVQVRVGPSVMLQYTVILHINNDGDKCH